MGFDFTGLGAVFDFGSKLVDKIFPDRDKADQVKFEMLKLQQEGAFKELDLEYNNRTQQIAVNIEEAKNGSIFVSGWRPAVGWTCAFALAYNFILQPFLFWLAKCFFPTVPLPPMLDMGMLMTLLLGMLGIGAMRSYDKQNANTDNK